MLRNRVTQANTVVQAGLVHQINTSAWKVPGSQGKQYLITHRSGEKARMRCDLDTGHGLQDCKGNVNGHVCRHILTVLIFRAKMSGENNSRGMLGKHHAKVSLQKMSEDKKGVKNPFYGKQHTEKTKREIGKKGIGNDRSAKLYPAFYNESTNEYIPGGQNLIKMCRKHGLNSNKLHAIKLKMRKQTREGWRLATPEEKREVIYRWYEEG